MKDKIENMEDTHNHYSAEYFWYKFEDLLAWSLKFDRNSDEYSNINKTAWYMLDLYLDALMHDYAGGKYEKSNRKD